MFRDIKGRYLRLGIIGDMKGYLGIFRDIKGRYLHLVEFCSGRQLLIVNY